MWSVSVVVLLPCCDVGTRFGKGGEQRLVETLVPEAAIEALDKAVLHRLPTKWTGGLLLQFLGLQEADLFVGARCVVQFPLTLGEKYRAAVAVCCHAQPVSLTEQVQGGLIV